LSVAAGKPWVTPTSMTNSSAAGLRAAQFNPVYGLACVFRYPVSFRC
jgi:hypothetical protein